jgi:hypothetical protein
MDDHWTEKLRCPDCRGTGVVSLILREDEEIPIVCNITDSFKIFPGELGPIFRCAVCDADAIP